MGVAQNIYKAFEEIQTACETIFDLGDCGKCPMRLYCVKEDNTNFGEVVYAASLETIKEFINYADKLTDVGNIR